MTTETRVPYVDLVGQHASIKEELLGAVDRVLEHGGFVLGPEVAEFELRFADLCDTRHAVGVSNGTAAISLALRALDIGDGDEVITAPNSFLASASAIALTGARPVFVDVADDFNLDAGRIEAAITSRTRAILPVHLCGRPARMDEVLEIAERRNLHVVEDAAQAVGASIDGKPVGGLGIAGAFSLHPLKNLNASGDGGVITTSDDALANRLRSLRNHGLVDRDTCATWSPNERLDTVQAAMLLVKLAHLESWTESRRVVAARYRDGLSAVDEVRCPADSEGVRSVYHTFVIEAEARDALARHLRERGVETKVHYPTPIHLQPAAASLGYRQGDFPVAERQASRILSLPVHPGVSMDQADHVVECVREFYAEIWDRSRDDGSDRREDSA